jgi:hypothetical protein
MTRVPFAILVWNARESMRFLSRRHWGHDEWIREGGSSRLVHHPCKCGQCPLGRSLGCPAIPMELHEKIIGRLANGTCLFIYYPDREYLEKGILSRESKILTTTSLTSQ